MVSAYVSVRVKGERSFVQSRKESGIESQMSLGYIKATEQVANTFRENSDFDYHFRWLILELLGSAAYETSISFFPWGC